MASGPLVWTPNRSAIQQLLTGGGGPVYQRVRKVQSATVALANRTVPVDKGNLRKSGHVSPIIVSGDKLVAGVEYDAPYAMFVHEGTRGGKGQPWLRVSAALAAKRFGAKWEGPS